MLIRFYLRSVNRSYLPLSILRQFYCIDVVWQQAASANLPFFSVVGYMMPSFLDQGSVGRSPVPGPTLPHLGCESKSQRTSFFVTERLRRVSTFYTFPSQWERVTWLHHVPGRVSLCTKQCWVKRELPFLVSTSPAPLRLRLSLG